MFPTYFFVSGYVNDKMVTFRYKSFSLSFFLFLVLTAYRCGGRSEPLVDDPSAKDRDDDSDADASAERNGKATDGIESAGNDEATEDPAISAKINGGPNCFDTGTDPNRNRVQPGNICDRLSTIQCAAEACCCEKPARNFNACKKGMIAYCRENLRIDVISRDDSTGFDPVVAEQVFSQYEGMASRCDTNVVSWGTSLDGLRGIVKGTIDPGRPCTPRSDWGETLDEAGAASLASCKDPASTACSHPAPLLWTCSPRGDVGAGCITDLNCFEGLYCENPNLVLLGATCKERKRKGSACTFPNECQSLICRDGKCAEVNQQNVYCVSN